MTIKAGERVPSMTLKVLGEDGGPKDIATDAVFKGKKVVLFALPGAFTRTCSAKHLPGFVANADAIRAKGVDTIACLSVNDAFVMGAWGHMQGAGGKVLMLADGNADFTSAIGMDIDRRGAGMGTRSKRYAMIVEDGVVTRVDEEPDGAYGVSSAEAVLAAL
ncbi:MAG: peroxiredoxin [Alphaproteobacteria bacterium]